MSYPNDLYAHENVFPIILQGIVFSLNEKFDGRHVCTYAFFKVFNGQYNLILLPYKFAPFV